MNWHLVLDYTNSLKWVVFATVVLVLFRTSFGRLIDRLTSFEGFGAKADFDKQAAEVAHKVKQIEAEASVDVTATITAEGEVTTSQGELAVYVEKATDVYDLAIQMRKGRRIRVLVSRNLDSQTISMLLEQILVMTIATDYGFDYESEDGNIVLLTPGESLL